jgi:predicted nuclease of restriction endonuclease-like (RecB) superfamily
MSAKKNTSSSGKTAATIDVAPGHADAHSAPLQASFVEVVRLIEQARHRAHQAVNTQLIDLYWKVGEYISRKLQSAEWGDGVVSQLATYLARTQPGLVGFSRQNLFRMRQFYETYAEDEKVSPLVRQLPWTHHLIILGQSKRAEEHEFYMRLAIHERWGKRELERQIQASLHRPVALCQPRRRGRRVRPPPLPLAGADR